MKFIVLLVLLTCCLAEKRISPNSYKFTKIECIMNEIWSTDTNCTLKPVRGRSGKLYCYTKVIKEIRACVIEAQLFKWYSGYRPYPIKFSVDCCEIFKRKRIYEPVKQFAIDFILAHSPLNYTCPFTGDVLLAGIEVDSTVIRSLLPTGTYRLTLTFKQPVLNETMAVLHLTAAITSSLKNE